MTRVTKLLSKNPAEGTTFVARPLMLKKSEIEQGQRRGDSEATLEKHIRYGITSDDAGGSNFKRHRPEGGRGRTRGQGREQGRGWGRGRGRGEDRGRGRGQDRGRGRGQGHGWGRGRRGEQQQQSEWQTDRLGSEPDVNPSRGCQSQETAQRPPEDRSTDEIAFSETTIGTIESSQGGDDDDYFAALHQKQDGKSTPAPNRPKSTKTVIF